MSYRERRAARADRLRGWSEGRTKKAETASKAAHDALDQIPLGQPILVGHHSEGRHRRVIDRAEGNLAKAHESWQMASQHASKAAEIDRQAGNAIYSDDPDAIEALQERIAGLEAERERCKYINKVIRKGPGWEARIDPPLTDKEKRDLESIAKYSPAYAAEHLGSGVRKPFKGYPGYHTSNLSGNIKRNRDRLARLIEEREEVTAEVKR